MKRTNALDADCRVAGLEASEFDGLTITLHVAQGDFRDADLILLYPEPRGTPATLRVQITTLGDE